MNFLVRFLHRLQAPHSEASHPAPRKQSGFTLIEAMVVVGIIAILGAMAGPAFQTMIRNNRLSTAASLLQVSLNIARGEAVKRGADAKVTVAAITTAGEWKNGWAVFLDKSTTANGAIAPTADTSTYTLLEIAAPLPSANVQYDKTGSLDYFTYNGQGRMITSTGGAGANRGFWFYEGNSDKYCIVVSLTGRVRTEKVASSASCSTS